MTYDELESFLTNEMRPEAIYQPVMIETILRSGGWASDDAIVSAFLAHPECDGQSRAKLIAKLNKHTKRKAETPGQVLIERGVVERKNAGYAVAGAEHFSSDQVSCLAGICTRLLEEYRAREAARTARSGG